MSDLILNKNEKSAVRSSWRALTKVFVEVGTVDFVACFI